MANNKISTFTVPIKNDENTNSDNAVNPVQTINNSQMYRFSTSTSTAIKYDVERIEATLYVDAAVGFAQLDKAISKLNNLIPVITENDWKGSSVNGYKEYVKEYIVYLKSVRELLKATSEKIIKGSEKMKEIDMQMGQQMGIEEWKI
ncbi:hypothetical protein [Listeria welshimeri]|uniref:hypothetical protein n=1 Tax=Listeria welshimeri TaxID=1643 RepID=UPI0016268C9D|nr:hypothetical protein [Listeria welshimeri]MBC1410715.1 hypothetical protein [Listeria welshimeri]MBC1643162.1 hypothetical protein [Listeria welshimeri]MBC1652761.1 hypothetical protein [Listeria welshimeri]MBC1657425.1 hypothetical protein [Listeria welshimeri]MBC1664478.1 hypothetical protein [Listeria welshimeri]